MNFLDITGNCPIPHYHMRGNPTDAFKHLGIHDKETHKDILIELTNLLKLDFLGIDFFIDKALKRLAKKSSRKLLYQEYFDSYLEGLGISDTDLFKAYMVPEVITALKKFMPKLPLGFLACSTLMAYDKNSNSTIHGRVLDFPVVKNYLKSERALIYDFPNHPKIWSLGIAGLPLASLTAMNSEGISLALHMKYGNHFNADYGHFVFELAFKILMECKSLDDVLKFLKHHKSISSWGLYLTFKDGTGMSVDLLGENFEYHLTDLKKTESPFEYQNNAPIIESLEKLGITSGLDHYCSMRRTSAEEKIKKINKNEKSPLDILTILGKPTVEKSDTAVNWKQDTTTITSVHTISMVPSTEEVYLVPGEVPKILDNKVLLLKNIFQVDFTNINFEEINLENKPLDPHFVSGFRYLSKAENSYEQKDLPMAYHYIQLAIDSFNGYPEQKISKFYFMMLKMINFDSDGDLANLLKEFRELERELPYYIRDHALLAIARLEKILHGKTLIEETEIKTEDLKKIYRFEMSMPAFILKKLRGFISLQFGTVDVIYTYPV